MSKHLVKPRGKKLLPLGILLEGHSRTDWFGLALYNLLEKMDEEGTQDQRIIKKVGKKKYIFVGGPTFFSESKAEAYASLKDEGYFTLINLTVNYIVTE